MNHESSIVFPSGPREFIAFVLLSILIFSTCDKKDPIVNPNDSPILSSGSVTPDEGGVLTIFKFKVNYKDSDGDTPTRKDVVVDSIAHAMDHVETVGDREIYEYSARLPVGDHEYYFAFDDGHGHAARFPPMGALNGPSLPSPVTVTSDQYEDKWPSWSATGTQIAFSSDARGNQDIYVIPASGGTANSKTDDPDYESDAAWSPYGSWIAYYRDNGVIGNVWYMPASGGSAVQFTVNGGAKPSWSPDEGFIVYERRQNAHFDIWKKPFGGGDAVQITFNVGHDGDPTWRPDGSEIAFNSDRAGNGDIWAIPPNGGIARQITTHAAEDYDPVWSPDGSEIAFVSTRSGNPDIWAISTAGENPIQITKETSSEGTPDWSRDGSTIAFRSDRSGTWDIWKIRVR